VKAYQIASALLTKKDFESLNWGKAIHLKVKDMDKIQAILQKAVADEDSELRELSGYKIFSTRYADGAMQKAYQIASAILDNEFYNLGWGIQISLSVTEFKKIETYLKQHRDKKELRGDEGFIELLRFCKFKPLNTWIAASAILGAEFLAEIGWPSTYEVIEKRPNYDDWVEEE